MTKQIYNPYLPLHEYIPDGEPHVFDDRLYIYGSHDKENGNEFCELDYVCYSAPITDLTDWRYEGVIFEKNIDPMNETGVLFLYAPDVCQGIDGRYYLYYSLKFSDCISVAVCDTPAGAYEYYGKIAYPNGRLLQENIPYDPAVICADGMVYLYYGFAPTFLDIPRYQNLDKPGGSVVLLDSDMLTVKDGPHIVVPSALYGKGTTFEGNEFFEAPSIRKIGGLFYLVYSSVNTHQLCYAVSKNPMSGFEYGGIIISNGDIGYQGRNEANKLMAIGNNHGGLVEVQNQWYIFYHRHTHTNQFNRQGCAEPVSIGSDGKIEQVTNGNMPVLRSLGRGQIDTDYPYITNDGDDRYITQVSDGVIIGFKYIDLCDTNGILVVMRGKAEGRLQVLTAINLNVAAEIEVKESKQWHTRGVEVSFEANEKELYFKYNGEGAIDIITLILE